MNNSVSKNSNIDFIALNEHGEIVQRDPRSNFKAFNKDYLYKIRDENGNIKVGRVTWDVTAAVIGAIAVGPSAFGELAANYVGTPLGLKVGNLIRKNLDLNYRPNESERRHPSALGLAIAHDNAEWLQGLGNIFLWGCRIGGTVAGFVFLGGPAGASLGYLAGNLAGTFISQATVTTGENSVSISGTITRGSPNVFFNHKPAARLGDQVICGSCSSFSDNRIIEGSQTVFVNTLPLVRVGHFCACGAFVYKGKDYVTTGLATITVGKPAEDTGWKRWNSISDFSDNLLDWILLFKGGLDAFKNLFKAAPKIWNFGKNAWRVSKSASQSAWQFSKGAARNARDMLQRTKRALDEQIRKIRNYGDPVDIAIGEFLESCLDFYIEATIPIKAERFFGSQFAFSDSLGNGRISFFDECIQKVDDEVLIFCRKDGSLIPFMLLENGKPFQNPGYPNTFFGATKDGVLLVVEGKQCRYFRKFGGGIYYVEKIEDLAGNTVIFERDQIGSLNRLVHSDGFELHFENDGWGRRTSVVWYSGGEEKHLASYSYDAAGNLVAVNCSTASSYIYRYNEDNQLIEWRDKAGDTVVQVYYDDMGYVIKTTTNGPWNNDIFEYDLENRCTKYRDGGAEEAETFWYDEDYNVTCVMDANGHKTHYDYNEFGQLIAETDAFDNRKTYEYDAFGNKSRMVDEEGRQQYWVWNFGGLLKSYRNGAGQSWDYAYDKCGNLIKETNPLGEETCYEYTAAGLLSRIIYADGAIERREYDRYNRLCRVLHTDGKVTYYKRDVFGRIISSTQPNGGMVTYAYENSFGQEFYRANGVKWANVQGFQHQYGRNGHIASSRNVEGREWLYQYGPFNRLQSFSEPGSGQFSYEYDNQNRIVAITNAQGQRWSYERDAMGRIVAETDFSGLLFHFHYNEKGEIVERCNPDGLSVRYSYDKSGLLTGKVLNGADLTEPEDIVTYIYDRSGQLIAADSKHAKLEFKRDKLGRLIEEICDSQSVVTQYDARSRIGTIIKAGREVRYQYDAVNRVADIAFSSSAHLSVQHDVQTHFDDSISNMLFQSDKGFRHELRFDVSGLLERQKAGLTLAAFGQGLDAALEAQKRGISLQKAGAQALRQYHWNKVGEPVGVDDTRWGNSEFSYSPEGQVTTRKLDGKIIENYTYDRLSNLVSAGIDKQKKTWRRSSENLLTFASGSHGERVLLRYDSLNRVIERRTEGDGHGTRIWTYRWNAENQLVGTTTPNGEEWHYAYDAFGRRVAKCNVTRQKRYEQQDKYVHGIGTRYLWSSDKIVAEAPILADGTTNWDDAIRWHYLPDSFTPLAREASDGTLNYIVSDHLGTPRELFDERGYLVWSADYTVWGALDKVWQADNDNGVASRSNGSLALKTDPLFQRISQLCPIRFAGQWEDAETGLYYNNFRYYDPLAGQYLSPDPIGINGGMRPHGYVANPLTMIDPLGLKGLPTQKGPPTYQVDSPNRITMTPPKPSMPEGFTFGSRPPAATPNGSRPPAATPKSTPTGNTYSGRFNQNGAGYNINMTYNGMPLH